MTKEDITMATRITKEFLQEHFRKHDSITLYKPDGTPITFIKQYELVMEGGHSRFRFKDYDKLMAFYNKQGFCLKPAITII